MPAWRPAAADAAKKIAASPASRKIAQQAAGVVAQGVSKAGASRLGSAQATRKQRALAESLARQVHGQLSRAVFIGSTDEHWVVWKDEVPLAAFPPVDGDLAAKPELTHVTDGDRFEPPSAETDPDSSVVRGRLRKIAGRKHPGSQ